MADSDTRDKAMELGRPLTTKGDRPARAYGAMFWSTPDMGCKVGRKCVRKESHNGACWPEDK